MKTNLTENFKETFQINIENGPGALGDRIVERQDREGNPNESHLSSERFGAAIKILYNKKYLLERDVEVLRSLSRGARVAMANAFPRLLTLKAFPLEDWHPNFLSYLSKWSSPLPVGSPLDLKLIAPDEAAYDSLQNSIFSHVKFQHYAPQKRVKVVKIENNINKISYLGELLPIRVTHFEGEDIEKEATLDLREQTGLQEIKLGAIKGMCLLPASLIKFRAKSLEAGEASLDLSMCTQLKSVSIPQIKSAIKLPASIRSLEFTSASSAFEPQWDSYLNLQTLTMGNVSKDLKLKLKQLTHFEGRNIPPGITLDLSECESLKTIKVSQIEGKALLPAKLVSLEYHKLSDPRNIDFHECKLTTLKVRDLSAFKDEKRGHLLPITIQHLEYENANSQEQLNLLQCTHLLSIKIINIGAGLQLPSTVTHLECNEIPLKTDMSSYKGLKSLKIGMIKSDLIGPKGLTHFEYDKILAGVSVDLSQATSLTGLKGGNLWGTLKLRGGSLSKSTSSNEVSFEYTSITSEMDVDLRSCSYLSEVKIDSIEGNLKLPRNIKIFEAKVVKAPLDLSVCKELIVIKAISPEESIMLSSELPKLEELECQKIENVGIELLDAPRLKRVKLGNINKALRLPASVREFGCKDIGPKGEVSLGFCRGLKHLKVGNIGGTLRAPRFLEEFMAEGILSGATLDLKECTNISTIKVGTILGKLILNYSLRNRLIGQLPSTTYISWVN